MNFEVEPRVRLWGTELDWEETPSEVENDDGLVSRGNGEWKWFSFAGLGEAVSSIAVSRQQLRIILWVSVCVASVFSAWGWFRSYAWKPDPAALAREELAKSV